MREFALALALACAPTRWFVITAIMLGAAVTPALADKRIVFDTIKVDLCRRQNLE
jgi:hypothetical protein